MQSTDEQFRTYVAARITMLRRTAFLLCGDWHLAEDIVQTALTKLYLAWRRLRQRDQLDAYARKIVLRVFLDERRRGWRRESPSDDLPDRAGIATGADQALDVRAALATLPRRQRAAVVLRYWEDLPVAEVAALLSCSEGTIKSQTARGLQTLRGVLTPESLAEGTPS